MCASMLTTVSLVAASLSAACAAAGDLPAGWRLAGFGKPTPRGACSHDEAKGLWRVSGSGFAGASARHPISVDPGFAYQTFEGDFEIVARFVRGDLAGAHGNSKCGLMAVLKTDGTPTPVAIAAARVNGPPVWLKLARRGDRVGAYESPDGVDWYHIGTPVHPYYDVSGAVLPGAVYAGLFVESSGQAAQAKAEFDSVRVDRKPLFTYRSTWFGNSFEGPATNTVNSAMLGLAVLPDGTCITTESFGEQEILVGLYKDGTDIRAGKWWLLHVGAGGMAVAARGTTVWMSQRNGIRPFAIDNGPPGELVPIDQSRPGEHNETVRGIAIGEKALFVSNIGQGRIEVRSLDGKTLVRHFPLVRPGALALDPKGRLWAVSEGWDGHPFNRPYRRPGRVVALDPESGRELMEVLGIEIPAALAADDKAPGGARLLVADNGADQQIKLFDVSGDRPRPIGAVGAKGGMFHGTPGVVADAKLNGISGIGTDAAGNIYTCTSGWPYRYPTHFEMPNSTELKCFGPEAIGNPAAKARWLLECVAHNVVCAAMDEKTGDIWAGADKRYEVDWKRPFGKEIRYAAFTANHRDDPDEETFLRNRRCQPKVRWIDGQRFVFLQGDGMLEVLRFEKEHGEMGIPCMVIQFNYWWTHKVAMAQRQHARDPASVWKLLYQWTWAQPPIEYERDDQPWTGKGFDRWIWTDGSAGQPRDGRIQTAEIACARKAYGVYIHEAPLFFVDARGGLWCAINGSTISCQRCTGVRDGVPVYERPRTTPVPPPFRDVQFIHYEPDTDRMVLGGTTREHRGAHGQVTEVVRYADWSKQPRAVDRLCFVPPGQDWIVRNTGEGDWRRPRLGIYPTSFSVAGDYLFVGSRMATVRVYDLAMGNCLEWIVPGPECLGEGGQFDMPFSISAHRQGDSYVVLAESNNTIRLRAHLWQPAERPFRPPVAPQVQGHTGDGKAILEWSGQTGTVGKIRGYRVYRADRNEGPYQRLAELLTSPRFIDDGRPNGKVAWYRVASVNSAGEGPQSEPLALAAQAPSARRLAGVGRLSKDGLDEITLGNWIGVYGTEAFFLAGGGTGDTDQDILARKDPPHVWLKVPGLAAGLVSSNDPKLPQSPVDPKRRAQGGWRESQWGPTEFGLDLLDGKKHRVSFYMYQNWQGNPLGNRFTFIDPATGRELDSAVVQFRPGDEGRCAYVTWEVAGRVDIRVNNAGEGSVWGIFVDPLEK